MIRVHLLLFLFAAILPSIIATQNPICTNGFTLVNNKCLKLFTTSMTHKNAVAQCSSYAGTLVTIKNAIDNRAVTTFVGTASKHVWIGLYCFQNDASNCLWDDDTGSSGDYSNFARSFPYTDLGSCVYYSTTGSLAGQWASTDCDEDLRPFVCEMPGTIQDYSCYNNYNGNCYLRSYDYYQSRYYQNKFDTAESICENWCGNLVSIHSANEIRYMNSLFANRSITNDIFIGALTVSGKYPLWTDGSAYNYNNLDKSGPQAGNCMMMSLKTNGTVTKDAWYHVNCNESREFLCKRPAGTICTYSLSSSTTENPYDNSSPNPSSPTCDKFIMAPGTFTSPGYPGNYTNNLNCSFTLATLGAYRIRLSFNYINTETCCDRIRVYDGDSADSPLLATLSGASYPYYYESTGNMLFVTFITDGSVVAPGFSANFLSLI